LNENFACKWTWAIKHGAIEVFIERNLAALERGNDHLVAVAEFGFVELKVLERLGALGVVPGIGKKNAADIPEKRADCGHKISPRRVSEECR